MTEASPPVDMSLLYSDAHQLRGLLLAAQEIATQLQPLEKGRGWPCMSPHQADALDATLMAARQLAEKVAKALEF